MSRPLGPICFNLFSNNLFSTHLPGVGEYLPWAQTLLRRLEDEGHEVVCTQISFTSRGVDLYVTTRWTRAME